MLNLFYSSFFYRFDLIFLMLDPQDELYDKRLGRHLVSLYYRSKDAQAEEALDMGILRDYIAYSKSKYPCPNLTDEAKEHLIESYVNMRRVGKGKKLGDGLDILGF